MTSLAPPLSARNETRLERCDRHLAELMQEVRVAQTGVQVLFGFLLTVPFTARFHELGAAERAWYFATLAMAGCAAMLLIAPGAHHRVLFRCNDKEHVVRMANAYALAGLSSVAVAMTGAMVFVATVVFAAGMAGIAGGVAFAGCAWCWYLQPLLRRRRLYSRARAREHDGRSSLP